MAAAAAALLAVAAVLAAVLADKAECMTTGWMTCGRRRTFRRSISLPRCGRTTRRRTRPGQAATPMEEMGKLLYSI
jgi:hypothetical protein